MVKRNRYSQEVRERAVRMLFEHEARYGSRWEAVRSIASKIGCSAESLRKWVQQAEVDGGRRAGGGIPCRFRLRGDSKGKEIPSPTRAAQ